MSYVGHGRVVVQQGLGGADVQRLGPEGVAEDDTHAVAAEADVDDLAQRLVVEIEGRLALPLLHRHRGARDDRREPAVGRGPRTPERRASLRDEADVGCGRAGGSHGDLLS